MIRNDVITKFLINKKINLLQNTSIKTKKKTTNFFLRIFYKI